MMAERKRAERLKPVPLPKKKPLTKEELAARPPPKKAPKLNRKQQAARRKRRVPKDEKDRINRVREEKLKKHEAEKKVYANLSTFHIFGEERFGPGPSYVPQRLLLAVLEQDRRAVDAEDQLHAERSRIIVPGGRTAGAVALAVANPNFHDVWAGRNPPIFDQVSAKGMNIGEGARF
jgi:hypothetical protein